jgi:hypothetical protein
VRLDPSDKQAAMVNRCGVKLMLGRLPEALADCDEAVSRRTSDYALGTRALVYLKMGNYAHSIHDSDAALQCETTPHYKAMALYVRSVAKLERGDTSGGDADMAAAKQLLPTVVQQIARYGVQ